jgi:hypothetical protein
MRGLSRRGAGRPAEGNEQHEAQAAGAVAGADRGTRRRLLAGVAGVLGVAAAEVVGKAGSAQANTGDPVLQGVDNGYPTHRTAIFTPNGNEFVQLADPGNAGLGSLGIYAHGQDFGVYADVGGSNATGVNGVGGGTGSGVNGVGGSSGGGGVHGFGGGTGGTGVAGFGAGFGGSSGSGDGVQGYGTGNGNGVTGTGAGTGAGLAGTGGSGNGAGVTGTGGATNGDGVTGAGAGNGNGVTGTGGPSGGTGVSGVSAASEGVYGQSGAAASALQSVRNGVHGITDSVAGAGVLAENAAGGAALQVRGVGAFSRSGVLTVAAGKSSATQTGVALTTASLVLATLQQNLSGVYVRAAVPKITGSSFTVYLSKAPTVSTKVAWFVVN